MISLNHFLRAKTFVLIVMVSLFAGLAWFTMDYNPNAGAANAKCPIKVYGQCYREKEIKRLEQYFWVARDLFFIDFAMALFGDDRMDADPTDFVTNLIVLRKEAEQLGIEPTDDESKEAIRNAPIFTRQTWINDDILVDRVLAPRGLTKSDLIQLGKDYLVWRKISDLLAAGNAPVPVEIDKAYVRKYQQFTASLIEFKREDFVGKVEITEEAIKTYYEENKGKELPDGGQALYSDEKRGFTMVKFSPPVETEEMTAEQKAEQRQAFPVRVNEIYALLADDESDFAELAAKVAADPKNKFAVTVEELPPFAGVSPPEALKEQGKILSELFSPAHDAAPGRAVTVPFPQADGGYLMFKVTKVIEPAELTLDEAREQIEKALTARESNLLVNEAATAARAKALEALDAGKPVAEAAKAAGVEPTLLPPFSKSEPPAKIESADQIVQAALRTGPGSASEVLPMPLGKGYHFLLVDKIELVESDQVDARRSSLRIGATSDYRRALFKAWFRERLVASGASRAGSVTNIPTSVPDTEGADEPQES